MFDLGWTELLLIGIVALIVVGPKDLPILFRKVGQFVGKAKGMAREFSRAMDDAADEAGIKDTANSLRNIADPKKMGLDAVKDATDGFKNWEPGKTTAALSEDRAEAAKKIHDATAKKAIERKDAEAAKLAEETVKGATPKTSKKAPAKTPAAKKPAAKKPAAKTKAATTKAATAKAPAKKTTTNKAPAKPKTTKASATKKPAAKKTTAKSTGSKA